MIIEWLKINVQPEQREDYIQADAAIWTTALRGHPGFLGKEVWINPADPWEVVLVIRWASREQWQAFPAERVQELEEEFSQVMATGYEVVESGEFQVRKFAQQE